jgi:adenosyl cobinamide kinase/adenosyl cobinamide phosphate guanylyltransferase
MLSLLVGPPRSGKSLAGEKLALSGGEVPLYVATLPRTAVTRDRIDVHRERRGSNWVLYETEGPWRDIRPKLERLFFRSRSILIDGLSSMLWLQVTCLSATRSIAESISLDLLALIQQHQSTRKLVIVDCATAFPGRPDRLWFNELMHEFHSRLQVAGAE